MGKCHCRGFGGGLAVGRGGHGVECHSGPGVVEVEGMGGTAAWHGGCVPGILGLVSTDWAFP